MHQRHNNNETNYFITIINSFYYYFGHCPGFITLNIKIILLIINLDFYKKSIGKQQDDFKIHYSSNT